MSGIKYFADTNRFIYLLNANPLLLNFVQEGWAFSYITEIELLSKKDLKPDEEVLIRSMLATCYKLEHTQQLTEPNYFSKATNQLKASGCNYCSLSQAFTNTFINCRQRLFKQRN